jgi:osmotically-inducible protein OsmY
MNTQTHPFDDRLRAAILAAVAAHERLSGGGLRVGVRDGIAHLAGEVSCLEDRAAAEALAAGTPGVRGVVNRIAAPGAPSPARPIHLDL